MKQADFEARKYENIRMREMNVGARLFPTGISLQNWRVDPKVKDIIEKNRRLREDVVFKN